MEEVLSCDKMISGRANMIDPLGAPKIFSANVCFVIGLLFAVRYSLFRFRVCKIKKNRLKRYHLFAFGSVCESRDHLETLFFTKSLKDERKYLDLSEKLDKLGRKLNLLIQTIQSDSPRK
jgi:hypothetical protein